MLLGAYGLGARFVDAVGRSGTRIVSRGAFPGKVDAAVRQKARWVAGIALAGWDHLGWPGARQGTAGLSVRRSWLARWMLWRDRRAPLAALILLAAYAGLMATALGWAGQVLWGWSTAEPGDHAAASRAQRDAAALAAGHARSFHRALVWPAAGAAGGAARAGRQYRRDARRAARGSPVLADAAIGRGCVGEDRTSGKRHRGRTGSPRRRGRDDCAAAMGAPRGTGAALSVRLHRRLDRPAGHDGLESRDAAASLPECGRPGRRHRPLQQVRYLRVCKLRAGESADNAAASRVVARFSGRMACRGAASRRRASRERARRGDRGRSRRRSPQPSFGADGAPPAVAAGRGSAIGRRGRRADVVCTSPAAQAVPGQGKPFWIRRQLAGWSLGGWLYLRDGDGAAPEGIAAASQLGGSRGGASARLWFRR